MREIQKRNRTGNLIFFIILNTLNVIISKKVKMK